KTLLDAAGEMPSLHRRPRFLQTFDLRRLSTECRPHQSRPGQDRCWAAFEIGPMIRTSEKQPRHRLDESKSFRGGFFQTRRDKSDRWGSTDSSPTANAPAPEARVPEGDDSSQHWCTPMI